MSKEDRASSDFIATVRGLLSGQPIVLGEEALVNIDDTWLRQQGIEPDSQKESEDLVARAYNYIVCEFDDLIAGELTSEKMDEFYRLSQATNSIDVKLAWLKLNYPNYRILAERAKKFVEQTIHAATHKKLLVDNWSAATPTGVVTYSSTTIGPDELSQWGVTGDSEELQQLSSRACQELELRVGRTLARAMSDQQLDDFEAAVQRDNSNGSVEWLKDNMPYYPTVVASERKKLGADISASPDKQTLIASWGTTKDLQRNNPGTDGESVQA
jgi:hypothetical protein